MKRKPTIRDVAALARVSVGTVSAVLNGATSVAESTRRRVLNVVQDLGYQPNNIAKALRSRRIASVGLIVPDLQNPFFSSIAEGVQLVLEKNDILLVLCITWARADREQYYAQALQAARLDGIIYLSGSGIPSPNLLGLFESRQILLIDESLPGVDFPFVSADNRSGARAIADHVLSATHRDLAIIGGPNRLWTSEQRLAGYREALVAAGLDADSVPVIAGSYDEASGYSIARTILQETKRRVTAILCANDLMALGALRFCKDAGIAVPGAVSITGFDDIPMASLCFPPLTTVSQPGRDMGRAAAQLLLHQIGGLPSPPYISFPTTLRLRNSVAEPSAKTEA